MTEYDFSPEAQNRHIRKMHGIARWRDEISSIRPADPLKPATPAPRRSTTMPDDHIYSARNIHSSSRPSTGDRGRSHKPSSKSEASSRHRRQVSVPAARFPSPPPPPPPLHYAVPHPPRVQPVRAVTYQHPPPGIPHQQYQNPSRSRTVVPTPSQGYTVQYVNGTQVFLPQGYYGPKSPQPIVKPSSPTYFPPQQKTGFFSKISGMFGSNRGSDVVVTRRKSSKTPPTQHRSHRSRRSSW